MGPLRWQWSLANRGSIEARLETSTENGVAVEAEVVSQDGRVLSRCARGELPDGHVVVVAASPSPDRSERPPIEAVLRFAPRAPICILRVEGEEIAPTSWPVRDRTPAAVPAKPPVPWIRYSLMALGIAMMVIAGVALRRARQEPPPPTGALEMTHRAANGLFIAHYPKELEPRQAILPNGVGGIVLEDRGKAMSLVVIATPLDGAASRDPWDLQRRLHAEALANLTKGAVTYEETARREEPCNGRPGAVTTGSLLLRDIKLARIRACAFVDNDAGYLILTALSEPATKADERELRSIVDATELTRLGVTAIPPQGATTIDRP